MAKQPQGGRSTPSELPVVLQRTVGRRTKAAARYANTAVPTIHDVATAAVEAKGAGRAIDDGVRGKVEAHLGADLGNARVHDDPLAQQASVAMGARAFAYGADVFLGPGESDRDVGLMAHELTHVVQQGAAAARVPQRQVQVGSADSPAEHEADAVAAQVTSGARPQALLVDNGPVQPGQMLKIPFMDQLRAQVTAAADAELGPIYSAIGCPYIERYFARYAGQPALAGEAMLKKFAPGTAVAATAAAMIPIVVERVRIGVKHWRDTGQTPPGLPDEAAAQGGEAPGGAASAMGPGQPLDGAAASRIGEAMGENLADVRVHTGAEAQRFVNEQGAIAVTAGNDIAFASGAYQPGTMEGDALLAHELAHVVQQHGTQPTAARALAEGGDASHEADADQAATGVMARIWGGVTTAARSIAPVLKADYGLQRCSKKAAEPTLSKEDQARKVKLDALVKDGKHLEAVQYICTEYGFTSPNMEIKIVDSMDDAWAKTGGDLGEGKKQTLEIGRDLFTKDYTFIVRTIGHEYQHVVQRSQKDPVQSSAEREFLAWSWEILGAGPQYDNATGLSTAQTALEYYDKMPEDRKKANAERKKQVDDYIAAHK